SREFTYHGHVIRPTKARWDVGMRWNSTFLDDLTVQCENVAHRKLRQDWISRHMNITDILNFDPELPPSVLVTNFALNAAPFERAIGTAKAVRGDKLPAAQPKLAIKRPKTVSEPQRQRNIFNRVCYKD